MDASCIILDFFYVKLRILSICAMVMCFMVSFMYKHLGFCLSAYHSLYCSI